MVLFGSLFSSFTFASAAAMGVREGLVGIAPPFGEGRKNGGPGLVSLTVKSIALTEDDRHLVLSVRGREITLDLEPLGPLEGRCGLKSLDQDVLDVIVTGCPGDNRWITIGGIGSWEFQSKTGQFKETVLEHGSDTAVQPPLDDVDSLIKRLISGFRQGSFSKNKKDRKGRKDRGEEDSEDLDSEELPEEITPPEEPEGFTMEVRYYYDNSMLKLHGGHVETQLRIKELHFHTAVILKHESIGRRVFIEMREAPTFMDMRMTKRSNANGVRLTQFVYRLQRTTTCPSEVAFHHLLTAKAWDGTIGIAYLGTVCHRDCWNAGITEDGWNDGNTAYTSRVMAHEMGHNLGMSHNFDEKHEGRDCKGYMSYGTDQDEATAWSDCAHDDWDENYNALVGTFGQQRVEACMVPK